VPYVGGIFHPTGFPAYAIAGWLFTHVFACGNVAWRMSEFSALCAALATLLASRVARRLGADALSANIGALAIASMPIVWQHSTRAGVNAFALLVLASAVWCALAGRLPAFALCAGLALASHLSDIWMLPGLVLVAVPALRARPDRVWATLGMLAGFVVGLATFAYLPVVSALNGVLQRDPTADLNIPYHPIWDYDHPQTPAGFIRLVSGADFRASDSLAGVFDLRVLGGALQTFALTANAQCTLLGITLMLVALWALRGRALTVGGLIVLAFGVFPFARAYALLDDPPKYYLIACWVFGVLMAVGTSALVSRVRIAPYVVGFVVIALNARAAPIYLAQRTDISAEQFISNLISVTPGDALIVAPWYYATPLYYGKFVEQRLGGRRIVTNLEPAEIEVLARTHTVFHFPLGGDNTIPGADVIPSVLTSPLMVRVVSHQAEPAQRLIQKTAPPRA